MARLRALLRDRTGATAVEYGFLAALVAIGLASSMLAVGTEVDKKFTSVEDAFEERD